LRGLNAGADYVSETEMLCVMPVLAKTCMDPATGVYRW
jgi:hypothetical protein